MCEVLPLFYNRSDWLPDKSQESRRKHHPREIEAKEECVICRIGHSITGKYAPDCLSRDDGDAAAQELLAAEQPASQGGANALGDDVIPADKSHPVGKAKDNISSHYRRQHKGRVGLCHQQYDDRQWRKRQPADNDQRHQERHFPGAMLEKTRRRQLRQDPAGLLDGCKGANGYCGIGQGAHENRKYSHWLNKGKCPNEKSRIKGEGNEIPSCI